MNDQARAYFGTPDQQKVQRRAEDLWRLLGDHPKYSSHGRAVGLAGYDPDNLADHIALTRLQGASPLDGIPEVHRGEHLRGLEAAGLITDVYRHWEGHSAAFEAAERILKSRRLPGDLSLEEVTPETTDADLGALDTLTQSCGVLLPMAAFLRGEYRPSLCLFARDAQGAIVAASAAVGHFHPDHSVRGKMMWWGMLSTSEDRRGEGISLVLGAQVLWDMRERFGFDACFTGIREGNAPSEAVCSRMGLVPTDMLDVIAIDPEAVTDGMLTK